MVVIWNGFHFLCTLGLDSSYITTTDMNRCVKKLKEQEQKGTLERDSPFLEVLVTKKAGSFSFGIVIIV